jgi:hypothetical protein
MVQITNQYWIVTDTNPTTQVWSGPAGAMVANTNATFEAWLNANDGRADTMNGGTVVGTSLGAAGTIRVQVTGGTFSTGQVFNFVGNNSGAAGAAAITAIDATHFDIQGSVFSVADSAGTIWSATVIDTAADLYQVINNYNVTLFTANRYYGKHTQTAVGDIVLSNPMLDIQVLNAGSGKIILPQMNVPGSIPIGVAIIFSNSGPGAASYQLYYQDGVTPVDGIDIRGGSSGTQLGYFLTDNSTSNGTFSRLTGSVTGFWGVSWGGTGNGRLTANAVMLGEGTAAVGFATTGTAGRALLDQGTGADPAFEPISGDATLTAAGVLKVTGINGAALPVGAVNGGTGLATLTAHAVMLGEGTGNVGFATIGTSGRLLIDQGAGADPSFNAMSGDATITNTGALTLASTLGGGGTTGDASHVAQIIYDIKGRLTTVTSVAIAIADSAITYAAEPANKVWAGPASGGNAAPTFRSLVGADLPNPAATTLGGVKSITSLPHNWVAYIDTNGLPRQSQPASTDLADLPIPVSSGGTGLTRQLASTDLSDTTAPTAYTPTDQSGAGLVFTGVSGRQSRYGNNVYLHCLFTYPVTVDASANAFSVPVAVPNTEYASAVGSAITTIATAIDVIANKNSSTARFINSSSLVTLTNAQLSGATVRFTLIYPAS